SDIVTLSRAILVRGTADGQRGWRVTASELERVVLTAVRSILSDQAALVVSLEDSAEGAETLEQILGVVSSWRERLRTEGEARAALSELIKQVQLTEAGLRVTVNIPIASVS